MRDITDIIVDRDVVEFFYKPGGKRDTSSKRSKTKRKRMRLTLENDRIAETFADALEEAVLAARTANDE